MTDSSQHSTCILVVLSFALLRAASAKVMHCTICLLLPSHVINQRRLCHFLAMPVALQCLQSQMPKFGDIITAHHAGARCASTLDTRPAAFQLGTNYDMQVLGALVLPHGIELLYNPNTSNPATHALQAAGAEAAQILQTLSPDLILLLTPHGIRHGNNYVLYTHTSAHGVLPSSNEVQATINIDMESTKQLMQHLAAAGQPVVSLEQTDPAATPSEAAGPLNLSWAEIIPWSVLHNPNIPAMIVSLPPPHGNRRGMVNDLTNMGNLLAQFLEQPNAPGTLILVSADLAHTHWANGPYGVSMAAQLFDDAMQAWVQTGCRSELLERAASYMDIAKTCGFMGSTILHGLLTKLEGQQGHCLTAWQGHVSAYAHPTYFGMMVAHWLPRQPKQQVEGQKKQKDSDLVWNS
eukprot:GHRR01019599.1.p1 GENE.GHRR01019599.1~~GHRR01019599.1.p1  ORF type:complete len:407 (-),score=88.75 GHRR01019599.1:2010-3230(-)